MGAFLLVAAVVIGGCVEREMTITTEPQGALVIISDLEVGRTPVTVPFTWYGDYEVIIRKDDYETINTHQQVYPPIYEIMPLDLLSSIAPWTFHDRRYFHYEMNKLELPEAKELIERAERMRKENLKPVR